MENHSEINRSALTRQNPREKVWALETMDELASESELTECDVREVANNINERGLERFEGGSE
ncbi:hypothetical protein EL22_25930 [Halostagnicola sp. A56]|nr:hypothetical protein EL22_25930 [Halostagnicola sp. A56]